MRGAFANGDVAPGEEAPRSPLSYPQYRELWIANAGSNFGSQVQIVGAAWVMASLTDSPQWIALVQTAIYLPTVVVILAGGAMADNYDRRKIMLVAQVAMLTLATVLAVLTWLHRVTPISLLALTFGLAALASFSNPCWQASVRDILPRDLISRAVALNSISINLARTVGPAVGGIIVATAGAATAFVVNAISFVGFIVALLRWKPAANVRTSPRERMASAMVAGVRYVALSTHVRNAVARGGFSGLSASAALALLPVLARREMGGSAVLFGVLLGAFGLGAIVGAWSGARLRSRVAPDRVVGMAVFALAGGLAILGWAPTPIAASLGAALCGAGMVVAHTTYNTSVQLAAPAWVTARSLAIYQTAVSAGMATGSAIFGGIAEHQGVAIAFFAASAAQVSAGLVGLLLPLPRFEDIKVEPLDWSEPTLDIAINVDDGPILIELDYRISSENTKVFLKAMNVRRRIRLRDGARGWRLMQDLNDGTRWTESYQVPSWAEYLRHNSRRTMADVENGDLLRNLNADRDRRTVRRYIHRRTDRIEG